MSANCDLPPVVLRNVYFTLAEAEALVMVPPQETDDPGYWTAYAEAHIMREVARSSLRGQIKEAKKRQRERAESRPSTPERRTDHG